MTLRSFVTRWSVTLLHGGSSSLFVGLQNGGIEEWNAAGEVQHIYKGHAEFKWVKCLLEHKGHLWSSSYDKTVRVWKMDTGVCVKTMQTPEPIHSLCIWQGDVVGGSISYLHTWNSEGQQVSNQ